MKTRLLSLLLFTILAISAMTGCRAGAPTTGNNVASTNDTLKKSAETATTTPSDKHTSPVLALEEAQSIALEHAGFTTDQVTALHTEYEIEHGIPQYDVEFHHETWEYDYEIHADTGEILCFSKDD